MATNHEDTGATPRSADECERIGAYLRRTAGCDNEDRLPAILIVLDRARENVPELSGLLLTVRPAPMMETKRGTANPDDREIEISEEDLDGVVADEPEIRFTLAHELVHVLLHTGQGKFFRMTDGNIVYPFLREDDRRAEWQADRIARAMLMPPAMVARAKSARELASMSGSPLAQAFARIQELTAHQGKATPKSVLGELSKFRLSTASSPNEILKLQAESEKLRLWNNLPKVQGEQPQQVRMCGKYQIFWKEFGQMTGCGWFIEDSQIHAYYERYDI